MSFEQIIRPFVARGVTPPVKDLGQGPTQHVANVSISVGSVGNPKAFSSNFSQTETFYMDAKKKEKGRSPSRETVDVKIYQNNDPTTGNFVTFRYPKTIWMQGPNGQWEQWKFADPDIGNIT